MLPAIEGSDPQIVDFLKQKLNEAKEAKAKQIEEINAMNHSFDKMIKYLKQNISENTIIISRANRFDEQGYKGYKIKLNETAAIFYNVLIIINILTIGYLNQMIKN